MRHREGMCSVRWEGQGGDSLKPGLLGGVCAPRKMKTCPSIKPDGRNPKDLMLDWHLGQIPPKTPSLIMKVLRPWDHSKGGSVILSTTRLSERKGQNSVCHSRSWPARPLPLVVKIPASFRP